MGTNMNQKDEDGHTRVYANQFDPNGNASPLLPVEDERIWTVIEEMLTEMQEECDADDKSEEELKAELEDLINELSEMLPQHKGALEAILTDPESVDYAGLRDRSLNDMVLIVSWIVASVSSDDYILRIYDEIEKLGQAAYNHPTSQHLLFREPLEIAVQSNRPKAAARICEAILRWSPFVIGSLHAIELACRTKNMQIVDAYIKTRGFDFIKDPEVIAMILQEDYVELMDFCLNLKLDKKWN